MDAVEPTTISEKGIYIRPGYFPNFFEEVCAEHDGVRIKILLKEGSK